MSSGNKVVLNSGHTVPSLGFGTWQAGPGEAGASVYEALKAGYRHLDLAKIYGNQVEIGEAIKKAIDEIPDLKRGDIFITSKLWNNKHQPKDVAAALDDTLKELGLEYLDLYLIHFPVAFKAGDDQNPKDPNKPGHVELDTTVSIAQTWKAMTDLPQSKTRAVGVSNFTIDDLNAIIDATGVVPAVNQIERHPRLPNLPLVEFCKAKNIVITAYSAFGNNLVGEPLLVNHPDIKAIAERLGATPAQVILAWSQHGGHLVIPKSIKASRIAENFKEDVKLDEDALATIAKIGEDPHRFNVPFTYGDKWDVNIFGDEQEADASTKVIRAL